MHTLKKDDWNVQKVRRYIRENKLEAMNKKTVEEEKNSRIGYRIDREVFNTFRTFIEKSKWDLKVEMDKLLDDNMKLEKKIEDLNDEIKKIKKKSKNKVIERKMNLKNYFYERIVLSIVSKIMNDKKKRKELSFHYY
jgi:cell division protein FtsB